MGNVRNIISLGVGDIMDWLNRYFGIEAKGSSVRTEILAGVATFLTMAYIIVVNPSILSKAGMDFGSVFVATILASVVGCSIMGGGRNGPSRWHPAWGSMLFSPLVLCWD